MSPPRGFYNQYGGGRRIGSRGNTMNERRTTTESWRTFNGGGAFENPMEKVDNEL